jgi:hypothetical protein
MDKKLPRGLRLNNPLCIRHSSQVFRGEVTGYNPERDPDFKAFKQLKYGYRAAFAILRTYIIKYNTTTIDDIVRRWCPDATAGDYIKSVSSQTGFEPSHKFSFARPDEIKCLVAAMAYVETGVPADLEAINQGFDLLSEIK